MKILATIKENDKGFGEKDHALQRKDIVKLYNYQYVFLFLLNNIFKEWGRIDYQDISSLEGAIIEAWACDIPYNREWRTIMNLYEWDTQ